jgi:ABC-type Zn2+ transport system substrate-binding protein/surface adhesin
LIEALKPVDLDRVLADSDDDADDINDDDDEDDEDDHDHGHDDDDDDDDDHDHKQNIYGKFNRPKITLSGPYHYQINFKNPDLIKTLVLTADYSKNANGTELTANLKSRTASGQEKDRAILTYSSNFYLKVVVVEFFDRCRFKL